MNKDERGIEINLLELIKKLLANAKYIVLVTCIFGIMGYVASAYFITPIYQAEAKMMVNVSSDKNMTNDQYNVSRNLVETYAVIFRSRDVLNNVKEELNLAETYEQLANSISVKSVNNTQVMQIVVRHSNRDIALQITSKLLEMAPKLLVDTAKTGHVEPIQKAYADFGPVSPSKIRNTVLMAFLGCALSCIVVFLIMLMDNTYKTDFDIQKDLDLPVLGVIPAYESCKTRSGRKHKKKGASKV